MNTHRSAYNTNEFEDCVDVAQWSILPEGAYTSPQGVSPYAAETTVTLPVYSDMLYFLSRGPFTRGSIQFACNGAADNVKVHIKFFYLSPDTVQHAKVCVLQRDEVNNGVGVFTSPQLEMLPMGAVSCFAISVELPEIMDEEPVQIDGLLTMMPLFSITMADSMDFLNFRSVTLQTSNAPIHVRSLVAETAEIATLNAPIDGDFTCTDSLDLLTSNGPITANVTLTSSDPSKPAQLSMQSSNSPITAQISLVSALQGGTGSSFKTTTKTTNGPLNVSFLTAPLDSVLQFEGSTSNAPASAAMHYTYEGDIYLSSGGLFAPKIMADESSQDPAGRGRQRTVQLTSFNPANRGTLEAKVRWGAEGGRPLGSVEMSTSNSPITLTL
ncbi:hypothetical protein NM688_g7029 [Phlebia brevispora]|uniref:Uncharacterized protein n=1 Tax=Phlebia brevispora TaxID=194682 RepID=A0ACC1S9T7_9APHY|nr:hypothetical protein NM688_g7029 [Phlebia brevispora]